MGELGLFSDRTSLTKQKIRFSAQLLWRLLFQVMFTGH